MIAVEEALERILENIAPLPAEQVSLERARGRVLAHPVKARVSHPPRAVSAMDGYAVRADDLQKCPTELDIIAHIAAGESFDGTLQAGQAVRIFTGAQLPPGADAIVIQEDTEALEQSKVRIHQSIPIGHYVRPEGLDFQVGDTGITTGKRLNVRDIALTAAMNVPWLHVYRKPRVAVLATGDEVVMPGEIPGPAQIVSSNGLALCSFIEACGGTALNLGIAPDNADTLNSIIAGARGADLLVTTGGASVGEHDLIRSGLSDLKMDFWKIAMRPGKPLLFGQLGPVPMLGLPGNPVSTLVCAMVFLRPCLERLQGLEGHDSFQERAILEEDLKANDRRQDYVRSSLGRDADGRLTVRPASRQDSSMLSTLAQSTALIVRPPHDPTREKGEMVSILRLDNQVYPI
ncbi:molybdopterin molybdotransferase MoeA [Fodinicurvata sediminis]|uniref:molybdopterin molybdotransferase MoeA n=1 Tax=Fodinicurvata sediminis TaxID=1121832 RepID=UPI0003B68A03|nr:gephyrin-like molybdotransferase Glp [Fodinicurvata sediminis]